MVNLGERWYDPREERFLSVEPLLDEAPTSVLDSPAILSAYAYADNNPLRWVDPNGRRSSKQVLWDATNGFNSRLTPAQVSALSTVPRTAIPVGSRIRTKLSKPPSFEFYSNNVRTLQWLTGTTGNKGWDGFVNVVSKVDDFSLLTIRSKQDASGTWSTQLRPFNIKRRTAGAATPSNATATGSAAAANPQATTAAPGSGTGASPASGAAAGTTGAGPPSRPPPPPPRPATSAPVTPPNAAAPGATGPP